MAKVVLLSSNAKYPTKGSKYSAGYDLYSAQDAVVPAGAWKLITTDIQVECPEGTYARIAPRSGLAYKNGISINAGVIDPDYTGNVGVILCNQSATDFVVSKGDRIAQMIFTRFESHPFLDEVATQSNTRGDGGYGSTGK